MHTIPTDAVPLATALNDIRKALASGKDRDDILLAIIDVMMDPGLNARLDRICEE